MHRTRLDVALCIAGGLLLAVSCADQTVGPGDVAVPFAISDAQRASLAATIRFAMRDEALSALADREAAARISIAAADLSRRVDANDRPGALAEVHVVQSELRSYRERAGSDATELLALAALSLALDHAEMLAAIVPPALYSADEDFD